MWTLIADSLRLQARKKGTGARGLRSILESVLLEAQYHVSLPACLSSKNVCHLTPTCSWVMMPSA
jgi:ATP-dependent protease Clp ATPase subunit